MLCVDTSFLFALYGHDAHTLKALALLKKTKAPLLLSSLNEFELGNALRFAAWRSMLPEASIAARLEALEEDRNAGRLRMSELPLSDVVQEANRLSQSYTIKSGHRSFDILHVAHARLIGPKAFLSFDANQLKLAKAVGLECY